LYQFPGEKRELFLTVDRLEYLEGIDLEKARVAMVKVCHRIEESPKGL